MRSSKSILPLVLLSVFIASCGPSSVNSNLDKARFALDNCSITNSSPCNSAITEASAVLASEPNNYEAGLLKSSAEATNAGFVLLTMMSKIMDMSGDNETAKFKKVHDEAIEDIRDLISLRSSITTLSGMTPPLTNANWHLDYFFQLGFLQSLEIFARPTQLAQPSLTVGDPLSVVNVANITSSDKDIIQSDFIDADNNLIEGGFADSSSTGWDLVLAVRQNYCVLHNLRPAGTQGFTLGLLQDLNKCQLCPDATSVTNGYCTMKADDMTLANGQLVEATNCAAFNFTACASPDPTEL